ncbi:hypothetical protein ACFO5K_24615 [Nocardia halotolerans]|uniref:Asp23/Gls24 family envelope stress response protein n=1 Tax=Nocardia halotolerans TaxID=1755878 RepID=A0ABV8VRJ7_9NOCA
MISETEMIDRIVAAIDAVDDVHPAVPMGLQNTRWLPWNAGRAAVDLTDAVVEIRVVAASLPLHPLLDELDAAVRPLLAGTPWAAARLRVHVVDLHTETFSDPDHDPGP